MNDDRVKLIEVCRNKINNSCEGTSEQKEFYIQEFARFCLNQKDDINLLIGDRTKINELFDCFVRKPLPDGEYIQLIRSFDMLFSRAKRYSDEYNVQRKKEKTAR